MTIDYSLYLVTDSTMIPESSTFLKQVEGAINNGATIVQLREKNISTQEFISRAQAVHELTKAKGIPLIINDRIDVALAIDAEGVHIGQDDMPPKLARKLLGPNKILGLSCSFPLHVEEALKLDGILDYVGLGTVFKTNTKKDLKDPNGSGTIGLRKKLQLIKDHNSGRETKLRCVAIGGINHTNAARVLYESTVEEQRLDGIAVVSCIMANDDAAESTKRLSKIVQEPWPSLKSGLTKIATNLARLKRPLVHHITNSVTKIFNANVTLAIGASPIMSELVGEFEELASGDGPRALVANIGTPSPDQIELYQAAFAAYNTHGKRIIYDPVGVGASAARLEASRILLNSGHVDVIKGNAGEITSIWKLTSYFHSTQEYNTPLMQGVDSLVQHDEEKLIKIALQVSLDFKTIVVVTGVTNYIVQNTQLEQVPGGHLLMGSITGSGCSLGSVIAAYVASHQPDLKVVTEAVRIYNLAGTNAGLLSTGPGTFVPNFIDELYKLTI